LIHYPCLELCSGDTAARAVISRTRPPAARHAPAWRVADVRCAPHMQRMPFYACERSASRDSTMRDICARTHAVYIQCASSAKTGMRSENSQCAMLYQLLTKTGERIPSIRHVGGLSCRLVVLPDAKTPTIKTRRKSLSGTQCAHVSRLLQP
jgi:hypothetical protein